MKAAGYKHQKQKPVPKGLKTAFKIFLAVFVVTAVSFFTYDLIKVKRYKQPPVFCIPVIKYDNGSIDYYGLGYKVWKDYDPFDDKTEYFVTLWLFPKFWSI